MMKLANIRKYDNYLIKLRFRSYKLRWRRLNEKFYPANFKVDGRVRRQDWDGEFLETGAFYITRRWLMDIGKFQNNK